MKNIKRFWIAVFFAIMAIQTAQAAFGDIDTTFGNNGFIEDQSFTRAEFIVRQPDGKLIVVGYQEQLYSDYNILRVRRYNSNGSIDTSFGSNGNATAFNSFGNGFKAAIQKDSKIVVVGDNGLKNLDRQACVWRFNSSGYFDTSFGTNGRICLGNSLGDKSIFLSSASVFSATEKLIVVLKNGIYRLNSNGTIDTTFGTGGFKAVPFNVTASKFVVGNSVRPASIYLGGGYGYGSAPLGIYLAKYKSDGQLDTNFGFQGFFYDEIDTAFGCGMWNGGGSGTEVGSIDLQSDGKIITSIFLNNPVFVNYSTIRHLENGSFDLSFNTNTCENNYNHWNGKVTSNNEIITTGRTTMSKFFANGTLGSQFQLPFYQLISSYFIDFVFTPDSKIVAVAYHQTFSPNPSQKIRIYRFSQF
jgi:uncharacterized delta-60 repeat protein